MLSSSSRIIQKLAKEKRQSDTKGREGMGWDGWERRQVSEKRRVLYSNDDREQEREKRKTN